MKISTLTLLCLFGVSAGVFANPLIPPAGQTPGLVPTPDPVIPIAEPEDSGFSRMSRSISSAMYDLGLSRRDEDDTRRASRAALRSAAEQAVRMTTTTINGSLTSPGSGCTVDVGVDYLHSPLALQGARLLMATMYQSCEAPTIEVPMSYTDFSSPVQRSGRARTLANSSRVRDYNEFNPYLANRGSTRPGCFNVMNQPPVYGYGAKPSVSDGLIDLHEDQANASNCGSGAGKNGISCNSRPVSAIDCSGFIVGAMRRMGLNLTVGEKPHPGFVNTSRFNEAAGEANSCLNFVSATADSSISPGDFLNVGANHIVMVEEVGEDPLGIKRHLQAGTCNRIGVDDFDFKFLHSGALAHIGVAKVDAKHPEIEGFMERFVIMAQRTCNRLRSNSSSAIAANSSSNGISILRHAGDEKPGCIGERERFKNEECIDGCGIADSSTQSS